MNRFYRNGSSPTQKIETSYPFLDGPLEESLSTDTDTCISNKKTDLSSDLDKYSIEINDGIEESFYSKAKERFRSFLQLSNNNQAIKFFGNKSALDKAKLHQKKIANWIIHPCSGFRFCWNFLMVVFLLISVIELPVVLSFFNDDKNPKFVISHFVSDTLFLLDIIVNFRTGILINSYVDEIILVPRQIFFHYMKTWFLIDFISSVPLDYFYLLLNENSRTSYQIIHAGRALAILKYSKIIGMLRLFRIFRLVRYIQNLQEILNISNRFIGTVNMILLILLLSHWNACLQFLIPMLQDFPKESWVSKCELLDATWLNQYTWCLFNAVSHMLSIGYGRYPPTSPSEAWLTIISVLTGVTCYALFVGHAAALIYSFDTSKRLYSEKFKQIKEYMVYMKLPKELRQKIVNYYEYRYQGKIFNESNILGELSECLREEIINLNCRDLVAAVPIFQDADQNFITDVLVKLNYEVFQPGNLIIKEGTIGTKMYFILEGTVDVITKEKEVIATLSNGSFFGEICLLTKSRRMASILARTHCSTYSLDRTSFMRVLNDYPSMRRYLEKVAAERLETMGKNPLLFKRQLKLQELSAKENENSKTNRGYQDYVLSDILKKA